jgi:Tol biopolymer transport system component
MSDVEVSPDGRFVAYSSVRDNPYGDEQVYVYDIRTGETIDMSRLEGLNTQPAWARQARRPCLLFTHDPTGYDPSVQLSCLTPKPRTATAVPIGQFPQWMDA